MKTPMADEGIVRVKHNIFYLIYKITPTFDV